MTRRNFATDTKPSVSLRVGAQLWADLHGHVLAPDGDEHGGALLCGLTETSRGTRLLARQFVPAIDGVDYVPGQRGYRALTPRFIRRMLSMAAQQHLVPLFVHGHGSGTSVAFSDTDLASHERGYPALLDISEQTLGALVLATGAIAGDIWFPSGRRQPLDTAVIIGSNIETITPTPIFVNGHREEDGRQALLFHDRGQKILRESKIGVIGAGGGGMLAIEWLSRLGVGEIVAVDPDRVEISNVSRLPGSRPRDARTNFRGRLWPDRLRRFGARGATRKVDVARRLVREAEQGTLLTAIAEKVNHPAALAALKDCDFLVLAADTASARYMANILSHQYLIPMAQVGVKVVRDGDGEVEDVFTVCRPVLPDGGCLQCAGLIDPSDLALESLPDHEREQADYGTGQAAPSVIMLNAMAVSSAITYLTFALTGLNLDLDITHTRHHPRRRAQVAAAVRRDSSCPVCGEEGRAGLGDLTPLPVPRNSGPQ